MDKILNMLSYRRLAGSKGEEAFIKKFIDVVPGMKADDFGNRYLVVGKSQPTVMFSAHTDSVHRKRGGINQKVMYDSFVGDAFLPDNPDKYSNCLGADDAAGVYVMLELIEDQVAGLYVFHRQEEVGGNGSAYFDKQFEHTLLSHVNYCIAFDRQGVDNLITHQGMERCCSNKFAKALAAQMLDIPWRLDDTGIFTDSANYMGTIAECTNLSVGYYNEHTQSETLNIPFLEKLIDSLLSVDWDDLPVARDPSVTDVMDYPGWDNLGYPNHGWGKKGNLDNQVDYDMTFDSWDAAYDLACTSPEQAADLLIAYCATQKEVI